MFKIYPYAKGELKKLEENVEHITAKLRMIPAVHTQQTVREGFRRNGTYYYPDCNVMAAKFAKYHTFTVERDDGAQTIEELVAVPIVVMFLEDKVAVFNDNTAHTEIGDLEINKMEEVFQTAHRLSATLVKLTARELNEFEHMADNLNDKFEGVHAQQFMGVDSTKTRDRRFQDTPMWQKMQQENVTLTGVYITTNNIKNVEKSITFFIGTEGLYSISTKGVTDDERARAVEYLVKNYISPIYPKQETIFRGDATNEL